MLKLTWFDHLSTNTLSELSQLPGKSKPTRSLWPSVLQLASVLAAVAAVTAVDFFVIHANSATAAFTFLILILGLATRAGLRDSITASVASMLVYNFYFLPPINTLTISDPQNWVALFAFLVTAVTASRLSSNAKQRTDEARARQQELQRMYDFSRALILGPDDRGLPGQIALQLATLFQIESVWFYDCATGAISRSETKAIPLQEALLRNVAANGNSSYDAERDVLIVPVKLGGACLGSLGVARTEALSDVGLRSITQLIAIALERARAREAATRMEASRQNEQLKSTLLDALAHEFKTPLTSVKVATTTILLRNTLAEIEHELVTVIDEETDRMTNLVTDAIELARIGTGPITLNKELCAPEQMIQSVLADMRPLLGTRDLTVKIAPELPLLNVDRKLSELVLRQLLSNALKYSFDSSPIHLAANRREHFVAFQVSDAGPIISKAEQTLIFNTYYRAPEVRGGIPGTGMGLSISREIVEAQGGRIWVDSEIGCGTRFVFTLPVTETQEVFDEPLAPQFV
jgi:two-component system sensor histidine kinase KdpD